MSLRGKWRQLFVLLTVCLLSFKLGQVNVGTSRETFPESENLKQTIALNDKQMDLDSTLPFKNINHYRVCDKQFVRYIPSALEQIWRAKIEVVESNERSWKTGCELLNEQLPQVHELLSTIKRYGTEPGLVDLASSNTSALEYRDSCSGLLSLVHIEPLISFLRHPLALCPRPSAPVLDKTYLLVPHQVEVTNGRAKKWLFDAGASTYDTGAGGASQSWFVKTYRARGIEFDRIIGWEAAKTDPANQWDLVPADIKQKTSWFNIPVTARVDDADNPLTFIKSLTRPEDFVVFKLDIDTPVLEIDLVKQLMADRALHELVDEFYFEHHVSRSPMQWHGWGDLQKSEAEFSTLSASYELFTFLREHGVRAHSWV